MAAKREKLEWSIGIDIRADLKVNPKDIINIVDDALRAKFKKTEAKIKTFAVEEDYPN